MNQTHNGKETLRPRIQLQYGYLGLLIIAGLSLLIYSTHSTQVNELKHQDRNWETIVNRIAQGLHRDVIIDVSDPPTQWTRGILEDGIGDSLENANLEYLTPAQRAVLVLAPRLDWTQIYYNTSSHANIAPPPPDPADLRNLASSLQDGKEAPTNDGRRIIARIAQRSLARRVQTYQRLMRSESLLSAKISITKPRGSNGNPFLQLRYPTGSMRAWALGTHVLTSTPPVKTSTSASLHLSSAPLHSVLQQITKSSGIAIDVDPNVSHRYRITVHCDYATYPQIIEAIASTFELEIIPDSDRWVIKSKSFRDYELQAGRMTIQSQYFAQRRTDKFIKSLPPTVKQQLDGQIELQIANIPVESRNYLLDAIVARSQVDASIAAMLQAQPDLGNGTIYLKTGPTNAPLLRFRGRNISLLDLTPFAGAVSFRE